MTPKKRSPKAATKDLETFVITDLPALSESKGLARIAPSKSALATIESLVPGASGSQSVWYIGGSDTRVISAASWTAAGITGSPASTTWDSSNGWSLDAFGFTSAQLDLLDLDRDFVTDGVPFGPRPGATPPVPGPPSQLLATRAYVDVAVDAANTGSLPLTSAGRELLTLADYVKLMPWFAALANRKGARANVVVMGDSAVEGYPVIGYDRMVPSVLAEILRANHPTIIGGNVIPGGRGYISLPSAFFTTGNPGKWPLVATGGALDSGTLGGYGAKHILWYASAAGKLVDTLVKPVTSFDLNITRGTAGGVGTAYWATDAGAHTTLSMAGASNTSVTDHHAVAATTSIEIGWLASGYAIVEGITEYNGDENAGITVHNCGYSGATAAFWNAQNAVWPKSMKLLNPHLLIINLGANDASTAAGGGSRTSTQFKADMTTLIAAIRTGGITCPIVINMMWDSPVVKVESWTNYVAAMKLLAAGNSTVVCVDHSARMPAAGSTAGTALGLYYTDAAHSNVNGNAYAYMAETLAAAISPR